MTSKFNRQKKKKRRRGDPGWGDTHETGKKEHAQRPKNQKAFPVRLSLESDRFGGDQEPASGVGIQGSCEADYTSVE